MRNLILSIVAVVTISFLGSCAVSYPYTVTNNPRGTKVGESSYKVILGYAPLNADAGAISAARKGNITKISTVDVQVKGGLFVTTVKTIVTGE